MSNIDLKNKALSQYEPKDVKEFLKEIGLSSYSPKFEKYQIDGYDLCNLSDDLLKLLDFSNLHDIHKLQRHIHLKLLHQLKINLSYKNKTYPFQLDYLPELTVNNLQNIIEKAFNINEVLLSTLDDQILIPQIKFIDLLLVEYEKYQNLKIFNVKETQGQKLDFSKPVEQENTVNNQFEIKKEIPMKNQIIDNKEEEKENFNFKINQIQNKHYSNSNSNQDILKNNNEVIPKSNFNKDLNPDFKKDLNPDFKKEFSSDLKKNEFGNEYNKNFERDFKSDFKSNLNKDFKSEFNNPMELNKDTMKDFKQEYKSEFKTDMNKDFKPDFNSKKEFNSKVFNKDFSVQKDFNKEYNPKDFNMDFSSKKDFNKEYNPKDYSNEFNKNNYIPKDFRRDLNLDSKSFKEISNTNFKELNPNIKTTDSFKEENQPQPQMQIPQKHSKDYKSEFPSFKPYTPSTNLSLNDNNNLNLNNPKINISEKPDFDNMKMFQSKYNQLNTGKDDLSKRNFSSDLTLNKDKKDFNSEINSQTPNYVFNSGELNKFEKYSSLNKNQNFTQNPTIDSLVKETPDYNKNNLNLKDDDFLSRKFGNYSNNNNNISNFQNNISEPSNIKDTFKRYQSEKRTFRTYNEIQNNELTNTMDDFKQKQFQKYNQNPLEELNDKFSSNNEQFNRFSSRMKQNNNLNNEDNNDMNMNMNNNNKTIPSLRGNFGLDRKPLQVDNQKEMYNYKIGK